MSSAMRILTVDDEPSMLRVLQIMLERMGHECAGAGNGLEAMEMLRNDEFDLVIGHFNSIQVEVPFLQVMCADDDGGITVCQGVC